MFSSIKGRVAAECESGAPATVDTLIVVGAVALIALTVFNKVKSVSGSTTDTVMTGVTSKATSLT